MTTETTATRPTMPQANNVFSQSELEHLWNDPSVSNDTLAKIASGNITGFANFPADGIASLNRWAVENSTEEVRWLTKADCAELLGIQEVETTYTPAIGPDGEPVLNDDGTPVMTAEPTPSLFSVKISAKESKRFITTKNKTNRGYREETGKGLKLAALRGLICFNGETIVFDSTGNAISAQHRLIGYFQAFCENPELPPIPVRIVHNIPAIFADTADTGRSRTGSDIIIRNPNVLDEHTLVNQAGESLGVEAKTIRAKMGRELSSVLRLVNMRLCGKNVNASLKPPHGGQYLYDCFDDSLDRLINIVYMQDATVGDTADKSKMGLRYTLGGANLAAAIILAELATQESPAIRDGSALVIPEPTEPVFTLDVDKWDRRLREFSASLSFASGPDYEILKQIHAANRNSKQKTQDKFASICYLVSELSGQELIGFSKQGTTNYALPAKDSITSTKFPHFGGADIGPWKAPTKAELEG